MNKVISYLSALDEERYEDARDIAEQISDYEIYLNLCAMSDEAREAMLNWQWLELLKLAKGGGIIAYILHCTHKSQGWSELIEFGFCQAMKVGDYEFARDLLTMFMPPKGGASMLSRIARAFKETGGRWEDV